MPSGTKVYKGSWYMAAFGGRTAKRHIGWSNDESFISQIVARGGFLTEGDRCRLGPSDLTLKEWDKATGKLRFTGQPDKLKASQSLGFS